MFYNSHIHIFKDSDVPRGFLPLGLVRVLATKAGFKAVSRALNNLNPFSDDDTLDRYMKFVKIGRLGSQQKIFEECKRFYPDDTHFAVLPMDMAFMGAGKVPRDYPEQLKELADLKVKYPQIIAFVHIDPRRKGFLDLLKKSVEEWGFRGVKIYPPLGYFPYDPDLYPVYDYCVKQKLPVISHCSPYNPVHFKGSKKELHHLLSKSKTPIDLKKENRKELCANFTNPKNWEYVLNDFNDLKICLGHFGSAYYWKKYIENPGDPDNWFVVIKAMLAKYKNLYADISFTLNEQEYFPLLQVLLSDPALNGKILFGSDYYMVETEATERRFGLDLRAFIGEANFATIATKNPEVFFKG
ncbi:MAG: amidohydrolase [Bacteroidales bacterium]|jgi:predicted TIM-barrel fold metal-dependent hydrolase|nr:amidohydrolase [Bacteroidales bacterium]